MLFALIIGAPLVFNIYLSLTKWSGIGDPECVGLDNYRNLLDDDVFWTSFRNTVAMVVAMVVVPTLLGLVLAAVLFDVIGRRFRPRDRHRPAGRVLPAAGAAGRGRRHRLGLDPAARRRAQRAARRDRPRRLRHDWLGDPNTALPSVMVVMVWVQIGYPVVIFMAALQRVDPELYEAAEIDGAGWLRRFRAITLPQIRPETFVVALTCTIAALKVFGPIFALTRGGPENATNVPSYFAYSTFFKKLEVGYGSAIATVLTLIIVVVASIFIRAAAPQRAQTGGS